MRVIVTRPEREAKGWVAQLQVRGFDALALPLIAIDPAPDLQALRQARQRLQTFDAVMFVSANAAEAYLAADRGPWPPSVRAWATGPGTAQALLAAGVPAASLDAPPEDSPQFDSEALWARVASQAGRGRRVLLVRGADEGGRPAGRGWLATRLQDAGVQVDSVAAYTRRLPAWSAAQDAQARAAASDGSVWLFSSSEAVGNLARLLPEQPWAQGRAIASHERIAQAVRAAGFGVVCPSRPAVDAIIAALESIG